MPVLTTNTGVLNIPPQKIDPWLGKVANGSAVAALSGAVPMKFGQGQAFTFDIGEAEYVAEGANKGPSDIQPSVQTVTPYKFHKTVRWTEEVQWADEDEQLSVVDEVLALMSPSLSRALDFGVFHSINPTGGAPVVGMTSLATVGNVVEVDTAKPYTYVDAADQLVLAAGYSPRDIAIDPTFAGAFSTLRGTNSEQKMYPNFRIGTEVSELDGHRASVSNTVGAVGVAAADTNVKAVVGDFSAIRWGIQRNIGLEVIRWGDPDGQGDLKRNNQIAFRAEILYGWGIATADAFALIKDEI